MNCESVRVWKEPSFGVFEDIPAFTWAVLGKPRKIQTKTASNLADIGIHHLPDTSLELYSYTKAFGAKFCV